MINPVKLNLIKKYLKDFKENKSICSACDACELIIDELENNGSISIE